jgi:transposase InsO family protein
MQYYLAVVREGTISAAAEALHVAQPSLSRQMKDLEEELGAALFVRGNRKITLTEEGMVLRKRAEEMVRLMQRTEEEISQVKNHVSGSVRIGAGESVSFHYLSRTAASIARGTYYNYILRGKHTHTWHAIRREALREEIQRIYDESNQIFGSGKICAVMKENGISVSKEMVRELMRDMGLISIRQDAKDLYDKEQRPFKNYLNQKFDVSRPNEVWVGDVTYFRFNNKSVYICVILDLYARMVVGYRIGKANSTQLVRSTFQKAYEDRHPTENLTFHSDRGANYQSKAYRTLLRSLGVTQSFSRAHVPYDNSVMETFFSNLKREELYRTKYRSENEFRTAVAKYMVFYNEKRPHAKILYKTPMKKEQDFYSSKAISEVGSNQT